MSDFVWFFCVFFFGVSILLCVVCFVLFLLGVGFFCVGGGCLLVFDLCFWGVLVVF